MSTYEITFEECSQTTQEDLLDIETLVKAKLLPLPGSAARIMEMLQNVNVTTHELADAIGYDPGLASRVMRLANSPIYAMQRTVATVHAAVSAIGNRSIYDIVMLGVAADAFTTDMRSVKTGVSIWEHSVAVALASRAISNELSLRGTEEAFTCGLLHDIGKNLLFQTDQLRYTEVDAAENEKEAMMMETGLFGYNHAQVGFFVSRRWDLADAISATILWHHEPQNANEAVAVTNIVNVADELATMKGMGLFIESEGKLPDSKAVNALGLSKKNMEAAWEIAEASLRDVLDNC